MKRTLSEKKVLKLLKIEDFRHLSKDSVMKLASTIDKMDPEVAKKALEQFPNFAQTVKESLTEYKDTAIKIIDDGNEDHKSLIQLINSESQVLLKMLEDDSLDFNEKFLIMDRIDKLQDRLSKENKELRKYRLKILGGLGALILGGFFILASTLGGKSEISTDNWNNSDNDEDDYTKI